MILEFKIKEVYGKVMYYPYCKNANKIVELMGQKTFTINQLEMLEIHSDFKYIIVNL